MLRVLRHNYVLEIFLNKVGTCIRAIYFPILFSIYRVSQNIVDKLLELGVDESFTTEIPVVKFCRFRLARSSLGNNVIPRSLPTCFWLTLCVFKSLTLHFPVNLADF